MDMDIDLKTLTDEQLDDAVRTAVQRVIALYREHVARMTDPEDAAVARMIGAQIDVWEQAVLAL